MKAAVCERYGPPEVVQIREVPTPVPADDEVLVKGAATTVNSGDARLRALRVPRGMSLPVRLKIGFSRPKQPIFGFDMAGLVEAVGSAVTRFRPGDRVVLSRVFDFGCHAEKATVAEDGAIATIPEGLGDKDAVALSFGGMTAVHFFRRGELASGEAVLINGASGAVGADHVVDYTTEDFTRNGQRYDVIMDNHGNAPYSRIKGSLKPGGRFLMVIGDLWQTIAGAVQKATITGTADTSSLNADFQTLMSLADEGSLKPVVGTVLPFAEIVEAHRRVDGGHKVGSLVLTFDQDG